MRPSRRLLAAFVVVAAVPACASRPVAAQDAAARAAQDSVLDWAVLHEPLEGGAVRFSLGRPAYVAVFAISPGEGVRLLYPTNASQNVRIGRGTYTRTTRRGVFQAARMTRLNAGYVPEVRYLYLIASSRPLHLDEPLRWPDGGRYAGASLGGVPFDPAWDDVNRTLEVLFDVVVPDADFVEVDTDVYAYYPDVRFRRRGRTYALSAYRCYDGRVVYAPSYYGRSYAFTDDWFGVDFYNNGYVGSSCWLGYYVAGGEAGGGTLPTSPTTAARRQLRMKSETLKPRDGRPSIPLDPSQLQPVVPGGSPTTGTEGIEGTSRQSGPRLVPRPRPGERQPEPLVLPPEEAPAARSAPPRLRPVEREPARAEPVHREPVRSEPVRSEPVRSEPVRSEPVRTEPRRSESSRPEPARSNPDPATH